MKKFILLAALSISINAWAGYQTPVSVGGSPSATASATASSDPVLNATVNPTINGGSVNAETGDVRIENRVGASQAAGSMSNTTSPCMKLQSNSVQVIFAGVNNTMMVRDLTCTLGQDLNESQKLALCLESGDYRKIREALGDACPIK